jgi:hypothetical protein
MDWEMKNRFALDIAQVLCPLHAISCLCTPSSLYHLLLCTPSYLFREPLLHIWNSALYYLTSQVLRSVLTLTGHDCSPSQEMAVLQYSILTLTGHGPRARPQSHASRFKEWQLSRLVKCSPSILSPHPSRSPCALCCILNPAVSSTLPLSHYALHPLPSRSSLNCDHHATFTHHKPLF